MPELFPVLIVTSSSFDRQLILLEYHWQDSFLHEEPPVVKLIHL